MQESWRLQNRTALWPMPSVTSTLFSGQLETCPTPHRTFNFHSRGQQVEGLCGSVEQDVLPWVCGLYPHATPWGIEEDSRLDSQGSSIWDRKDRHKQLKYEEEWEIAIGLKTKLWKHKRKDYYFKSQNCKVGQGRAGQSGKGIRREWHKLLEGWARFQLAKTWGRHCRWREQQKQRHRDGEVQVIQETV